MAIKKTCTQKNLGLGKQLDLIECIANTDSIKGRWQDAQLSCDNKNGFFFACALCNLLISVIDIEIIDLTYVL